MNDKELLAALGRLKVETGSLACMGCGYEQSCGVHGCAVLRAAEERLRELLREALAMTMNWLGVTEASKVALEMTEE